MMTRDLSIWWRSLRAYSFTATLIPVLLAFLFARAQGLVVMWSLFPLMLLFALLLHAGVNVLNDYYDFTLGFDTAEASGSSGLLLEGIVPPAYMLRWGRFYIFAGATAGLLLAALRGWPLLLAGVAATAGAWFYSNRVGFKYKGLGEPFVFILMGPLLFDSSFYTATGTLTSEAVWPATACGCLVTAILMVNNLRDIEMDSKGNFITLPMRLGVRRAKQVYVLLIATAFLMPVGMLSVGHFKVTVLLPLLCLPVAARMVQTVQRAVRLSVELANGPQRNAQLYLIFGLLLAVGLFFSL